MRALIFLSALAVAMSRGDAQWVKANGVHGGHIVAFAVSPDSGGTGVRLFAGTSAGIYLSTTQGRSWAAVNSGLGGDSIAVHALAVSGKDLFAGTGSFWKDDQVPLPWRGGVFLSTNNGDNWAHIGLAGQVVFALAVSDTNVFAGTIGGVFLSTDRGTSWAPVNDGLGAAPVHALLTSGTSLIAGTYGGVFLSTNNGRSWIAARDGLPADIFVRALAISGSNILAGTDSSLFLSTNNGTTWIAASNGLPPHTSVNAIAALNTVLFAGTSGGVCRSTDNGARWIAVNAGLSVLDIAALSVSDGNLLAGTWGGGVYRSVDGGGTWMPMNEGLPQAAVTTFTASGPNLFVGTDEAGVFRSSDDGANWVATSSGLTTWRVRSLAGSDTEVFAGTGVGVFRSTDNGASWRGENTGLTIKDVNVLGISGTDLFAGTPDCIFLTTNSGRSWTAVNSGLYWGDFVSLAFIGARIFAGSYGKFGGHTYLSTDTGANWIHLDPHGPDTTSVWAPYVVADGATILAANYGGDDGGMHGSIVFSTDSGANWNSTDIAYEGTVPCMAISGTNFFVGAGYGVQCSKAGVLLSTDNGTNWNEVNSGLADSCDILTLFVTKEHLFAGTSNGVWRRPLSQMITAVEPVTSTMPRELSLHQNYPNPFNPSTTIRYGLPERSHVTLTVFNTLGQQVAKLVEGEMEAGYHEVKFDASPLSSGVYLYRLTAGEYVQARKLILLR